MPGHAPALHTLPLERLARRARGIYPRLAPILTLRFAASAVCCYMIDSTRLAAVASAIAFSRRKSVCGTGGV